MGDNKDWDAEWDELANKAWAPETQMAGSTQIMVQDFRGWWGSVPSLPLFTEAEVRTSTNALKI